MQLNGSLANFTLPELIQMMGGGGKSGLLSIEGQEGEARLYFSAGQPVHAEADELTGEEAFFRMFRLSDGRFAFIGGVAAPRRTIHVDWTALMIEAARLLDENLPENAHSLSAEPFAPYVEEPQSAPDAEALPFGSSREHWEAEPDTPSSTPQPLSFHPHLLEAAERLGERIEATGDAVDFTVISRDGLLRSGPALNDDADDPEGEARLYCSLIDGATLIGEELGLGRFKCAVLHPRSGERRVLFTVGGLLGCAALKAGRKPISFLTNITRMTALKPLAGENTGTQTALGLT